MELGTMSDVMEYQVAVWRRCGYWVLRFSYTSENARLWHNASCSLSRQDFIGCLKRLIKNNGTIFGSLILFVTLEAVTLWNFCCTLFCDFAWFVKPRQRLHHEYHDHTLNQSNEENYHKTVMLFPLFLLFFFLAVARLGAMVSCRLVVESTLRSQIGPDSEMFRRWFHSKYGTW